MKFSLAEIARLEPLGMCNLAHILSVKGVSIDSRTFRAGEMFFAIRGEFHDGHAYIPHVLRREPGCIVAEETWFQKHNKIFQFGRRPVIIVRDSLKALAKLAELHRHKHDIPLIAVAGSNGKTTTKDLIAKVLSAKFNVLKTQGNLNNHIGVPLTLLSLRPHHEIAVIEMGTNHFGEIRALCEVAHPTHGIITNIGKEHLEFFKTLNGVFKAETELADWLSQNRANNVSFFRNADDPFLRELRLNCRSVSYSMTRRGTDYKGDYESETRTANARLEITPKKRKGISAILKLPGNHNAMNALAAAAVGFYFKVGSAGIKRMLSQFKGSAKRTEILKFNGITIINDSYNANPDSMTSAIALLGTMDVGGKKIAVLGDMKELGESSIKEHAAIGRQISSSSLDVLFTFGKHVRRTASITRSHSPKILSRHFGDKNALVDALCGIIAEGDVILLKGSRGMKMEEVLPLLKIKIKKRKSA